MEALFLGSFAFGALFSLASVLLGFAGSAAHAAHPGHAGHGGELLPAGHDGHAMPGHGGSAQQAAEGDAVALHRALPLLNVSSLLAFLTWFGAAGYVLLRFADWPLVAALAAAVVAGGGGALVIALFLAKVLSGEREMDPREYRMEGTIARVTVTVPAAGAGEIVFSKGGSRRSEAARSLSGRPIPRETEVVVVEYEHGVAAVQPWDEFVSGGAPPAPGRGVPPAGGQ